MIIRNIIQFGRLAIVMRRSGKSIFSRVPAIDLEEANDDTLFALDLDLDDVCCFRYCSESAMELICCVLR